MLVLSPSGKPKNAASLPRFGRQCLPAHTTFLWKVEWWSSRRRASLVLPIAVLRRRPRPPRRPAASPLPAEVAALGVEAGARGGFTTLCCMPNTVPTIDSATVVKFIDQQAKAVSSVRVLVFGAVTLGREGKQLTDMEELAQAGVVGFTDDGSPVATGFLMQNALLYAGQLGLPVMDHCEDYSISKGRGMNEGWGSARLGLPGYPSAARRL